MADDALTLDSLPSLTRLVLSASSIEQKDLGRLACFSRRLRDATRDDRLPAWARVRVVGELHSYDVHHETFHEGGVDSLLPPKPPRHSSFTHGATDPYKAYLEDAIDGDKALRGELLFDAMENDGKRRNKLTRHVKIAWEQQGAEMRAAYASKLAASSAAYRAKAAAYKASSIPCPTSVSHLDALLALCTCGVHTLVLPVPLSGFGGAEPPPRREPVVRDDTLSRIASSWGPSLRVLNLGCAVVSRAALHAAIHACPALALLDVSCLFALADSPPVEGCDMFKAFPSPPHAALRSLALPSCPGKLVRLVNHATKAFAKLKDIEMNTVQADPWFGDTDGEEVAAAARAARKGGVKRFICPSFFATSEPEGSEYDGSGHYCGDGEAMPHKMTQYNATSVHAVLD